MQSSSPLSDALAKLTDFVLTSPRRPADEPFMRAAGETWFAGSDRVIEEWEATSFCGYLSHGYADALGDRAIDRFLRAPRSELSAHERAALEAVRARAYASLFEIVEVRLDVGLALLDRVSGEQLFVREKLGTHGAAEGDHLLAWIVPFEDHIELLGPVTQVPPAHVAVVQEAIARARGCHGAASSQPGVPLAALPAVHRALREAVRDYNPTFEHQSGEPVLVCRAIYEVKATEAVREKLSTSTALEGAGEGRFLWWQQGARGRPDKLAEIQLRTVRLSVMTLSRKRLAEARRFAESLLGKLVQHRVDRYEDPLGRPLGDQQRAFSPGLPTSGRVVLANDVETSIAGFHRQLGAYIRGTLPSPEGAAPEQKRTGAVRETAEPAQGTASAGASPAPDDKHAGPRAPPPEIDPAARMHRLPPAGHEVMQALVSGMREVVSEIVATARRRPDADSLTLTPPDLVAMPTAERFLHDHARSLVAGGWEPSDAAADADHLGSHLLAMVNHAIHGKKTFWVDESLAWMLAETDLDIVGRSLRIPFPSCAIMFTDRGTLEVAESLLAQEGQCSHRGQTLRMMSVYVTREHATALDEPQTLNMTFLFDARGDKWPYLVSRDLFVEPDQHLDAILDSRHPSVSTATRDPIFLAPELKKLVHVVLNAILYATSANVEPIVLSSKLRRLKQSMMGKGQRKREPIQRQLASLRGVCSSEDVFHLPGKIDISKVKRLSDLRKSESGRTLMIRFMVRGHWRRANPDWQDQRLRWIEPYWKGPEIGAAIERDYRIKP
jgi:hypothetical protein